MFPNLNFELERELVVHLVVGIHVAYVVVADQGHVTKFSQLYQRGVNHVASRVSTQIIKFFKSELIFTIVITTSSKMTSDCL